MREESTNSTYINPGSESRRAVPEVSQTGKIVIIMALIFCLIILPMAVIISQSLRIVNLNYQLERLEDSLSEVQQENGELERTIAEKRNLDRIERVAREDLNMVEAEKTTRLALYEDTPHSELDYASADQESSSWFSNIWRGVRRAAAATLD